MSDSEITVCQVLLTLKTGGAEILAAQLARRLSGPYRIVFACLESTGEVGDRLTAEGFAVHVLDKRPGVDQRVARRLRRVLHRERVDLIHAHQYGPLFYASLARLPSGRPPIVMTEHGTSYRAPRRLRHAMVDRLLLRRRDRIYGVGREVARALVEVDGFPDRSVGVILNGVDLSPYVDCRRDRSAVRAEIGLGADDFVLILVARLVPVKDHSTALRTLKRLLGQRGDVRLVIVGDGSEASRLAGAVESQGLSPYVRMLGRRDDVPRLFGASDLAILTSLSEGIPLSLIEAMAAGLPVVATRVGGVPEVVVEGETGHLAPAGDDAALSGHVLDLIADPASRARLGEAGRERAHALFSEDAMCSAYDEVYRSMIEARMRPSRG